MAVSPIYNMSCEVGQVCSFFCAVVDQRIVSRIWGHADGHVERGRYVACTLHKWTRGQPLEVIGTPGSCRKGRVCNLSCVIVDKRERLGNKQHTGWQP
jgi:hypothetical protein